MASKRLIALLLPVLWVCLASAAVKTVNIPAPKTPGQDYSLTVREILDANDSDLRIVFPDGVFHFHPEHARGKYHAITNHDNGFYRFAFLLSGKKNITVEGSGKTEFIFHGLIIPFLIERSEGVSVKGVTIDWQVPFYLQGDILASDPKAGSIEIEIPEGYKHRLEKSNLVIVGEGWEHYSLGENMVFDPATRATIYRSGDYAINVPDSKNIKAEKTGPNRYRLTTRFAKTTPPVGSIITFKGLMGGGNRTSPAFHLSGTKNTTLENITIHHCGGMGVIGEKSDGIHLNGVRVALREGSDRMVSSSADATHFCNCRGSLLVENCLFENMLDDGSNVHGTYMGVASKISDRKIEAYLSHFQQMSYDFAQPGDKVRFIRKPSLMPMAGNEVESVDKINDKYYVITFKNPVPHDLKQGDGIENISWYPDLVFRNNTVRNNRARSILIANGGRSLVEGNTFSSSMYSIYSEGDLDHWFESGAIKELVIRNNTFLENGYAGRKGPVIMINPHGTDIPEGQYYEANISITGNTFATSGYDVLEAYSVDGLVFENNTIKEASQYTPVLPDAPNIKAMRSKNVTIKGNKYERKRTFSMEFDTETRRSVKME